MENNPKNQEGQQAPKLSDNIDIYVKVVLAFFLGAILAGTLVQFALPVLAEHINSLMIGFIAVIGVLTLLAFLFTVFKEFFFKLFFGISKADLEDVKNAANAMATNAVKKDWVAASQDFKVVSQKGSAWYAWLAYRRWVVTVFYTLFLAFAGLLGSVLLFNQNQLLEKQNEKIDNQIQLEESSRRGNLIVMMSNIMDKVDEEIRRAQEQGDSSRSLSPQLIGRIGALSYAFRPYRFLQDSVLIEKPLSPERGQLLLALVNSDLDSLTYRNIYIDATFEQANLKGANLIAADLSAANLRAANLRAANLSAAYLIGTNLIDANLSATNLSAAYLSTANLSAAYLIGANLSGASLIGTNLIDADLSDANLSAAYLIDANLSAANLKGANLSAAYLNAADLSYADLSYADLSYADLKDADLNNTRVFEKDWLVKLEEWKVKGKEQILEEYKVDTIPKKYVLGNEYYLIKPKS